MFRYFALVLIGVVLGWFLHTTAAPPVESALAPPSSGLAPEEPSSEAPEVLQGTESVAIEATPVLKDIDNAPSAGGRILEVPVFSSALLRVFRSGFRTSWEGERLAPPSAQQLADGEVAFKEAVLLLPGALGTTHAAELTALELRQEALADGDGLGILAAQIESDWTPAPSDLTAELMDRVFERGASSGIVEGETFIADAKLELTAGTTLRFGAGIFTLKQNRLRGKDGEDLPTDITLIGAGMNATLLRIGDISIRGNAERLTFRNLTLDCENDGLFDMRRGGLVCEMENVRVVRFDAGHGGCTVFSSRGGTLVRARNCQFTGGYGRNPGAWGAFLWNHGQLTGRFENCQFEGVWLEQVSKGTLVYENCRFNGYGPKLTMLSSERVLYNGCSVTDESTVGDGTGVTKKNLSDLFWQAK